jgi:hypothetical protein
VDRVAHAGDEERDTRVLAVQPALGEHGLCDEPRVNARDLVDHGRDPPAIPHARVELPGAEVLVHMPHPAPAPLRGEPQELGHDGAEPQVRQPAPDRELVPPRVFGRHPLRHDRAHAIPDLEPQPEHMGLELLMGHESRSAHSVERLRERARQLAGSGPGQRGNAARRDRPFQARDHSCHSALAAMAVASWSR